MIGLLVIGCSIDTQAGELFRLLVWSARAWVLWSYCKFLASYSLISL